MKKIKDGTLESERQRLIEELMAMRNGHIGGRRKKVDSRISLVIGLFVFSQLAIGNSIDGCNADDGAFLR